MNSPQLTANGLQNLNQKKQLLEDQRLHALATLQENYRANDEDAIAMALTEKMSIEQQLFEVSATLSRAKVRQHHPDEDIGLGTTVHLLTDGGERVFTLVDTAEADPFMNRISPESPLGRQLTGHHTGEVLNLSFGGGSFEFKILEIE